MSHQKRMKRIKEHFDNISLKEFEENILDCDYNRIASPSEFNLKLLKYEEDKNVKNDFV